MKSQPCADKHTQGCVRHLKLQNRTVEEFQETPAKCQNTTKKNIRRKQHSCRLSKKKWTPTLRSGHANKPDHEGALVTLAIDVEVSLKPDGSESAPVAT